ncbi:Card1-like endonuclease domain-containing protein [Halomonas sp. E19]|uniref:Card1-like endonuclease domain-containing protein n=1 Tax=Halomonas sp. E19 TaxID=3397247 RepID=UPI00403444F0
MPHLHIALVTERPETSLIPILQLRPRRIVLVPCQSSPQAAERLAILLRHELPSSSEVALHPTLPCGDPVRLAQHIGPLVDALQREQFAAPGLALTYDLGHCDTFTALLFQQAMRRLAADWLYVDREAGVLYRLAHDAPDDVPEATAIEPVLDVDRYLQASGRKRVRTLSERPEWRRRSQQRRAATLCLAQHADRLGELLGDLAARLVQEGLGEHRGDAATTTAAGLTLPQPPPFPATEALARLADAGLLRWSSDAPQQVAFTSADAADYLGGGWLAEYAWHSACDAGLAQVCGATHILDLDVDRNALPVVADCLAIEHNRLLCIECLVAGSGPGACLAQGLERLQAMLEHTAGLDATRVLLACGDFGPARRQLDDLQHRRGRRIEVLEGAELRHLPALLRHWKEHGRWPGS